jgi:hypothetical protein
MSRLTWVGVALGVSLLVGCAAQPDRPHPSIDMRVHALPADYNGPPPVAICALPRRVHGLGPFAIL